MFTIYWFFFSDFIDTSTSSVSIVILLDTEIATSN